MYSDVSLFIDGAWGPAAQGRIIDVVNPASAEKIGTVPHAAISDLDRALAAADKGFNTWRKVSAFDRSKVMRKAADILRERANTIARLLTMEQGKPLAEAKGEVLAAADVIDWFAEEARRAYGRVIPAAPKGFTSWSSKNRSDRLPHSRRGTFRSIKWSGSCRRRWPRDARSSSRRPRKHPPHQLN